MWKNGLWLSLVNVIVNLCHGEVKMCLRVCVEDGDGWMDVKMKKSGAYKPEGRRPRSNGHGHSQTITGETRKGVDR